MKRRPPKQAPPSAAKVPREPRGDAASAGAAPSEAGPGAAPKAPATVSESPALREASRPWAVFGALIVCLSTVAILASGRLADLAGRQDYGPRQRRLQGLAEAWRGQVEAWGLDAPEAAMDRLAAQVAAGPLGAWGLGRAGRPATRTRPGLQEGDAGKAAGVTATPLPRARESGSPVGAGSTAPTPSPSPTLAALRTVTLADPLRILVIGDSFAEPLGYELQRLAGQGEPIAARLDFKIATALTRPDYFDWPARLAALMAEAPRPEAVVAVFGGNENQNMLSPDGQGLWRVGDPDWKAEYQRRVAAMMDLCRQADLRLYWVGMPPMEDESHMAAARAINEVVPAAGRERPWVRFVPTWDLFAGPDGGFTPFQRDAAGEELVIRQGDGVHLTRPASDRLTAHLLARMKEDWRLVTPTPTATSTATPTPTATSTALATATAPTPATMAITPAPPGPTPAVPARPR